ncbi:MAG TPA: F0F1 ATP synthase subunit A, partial [Chitinophagaceae bacterium]|nr:F0F1 ATP synthase subunit A [Chitinophagaceae bacterium]
MILRRFKCLLVAAFGLLFTFFFNPSFAGENGDTTVQKTKKSFDINEVIFGHISDAHEFHFFSYESGGKEHEVTIPLPVIL